MAAEVLRIKQSYSNIKEQCQYCNGVTGARLDVVIDYLNSVGISSLNQVTEKDILSYREYVSHLKWLSESQKKSYINSLEQVVFSYLFETVLSPEMNKYCELILERSVLNKTIGYLLMIGIRNIEDITYHIRECYENYLCRTISTSSVYRYLKALDVLKLKSIELMCESEYIQRDRFIYKNEKVFLLYYPDYTVAKSFYYIQDKSELLFDFSLEVSTVLKHQVFDMLKYVLETNINRKDRRERFIVPLGLLFKFSVKYGIKDLEQLLDTDIALFKDYLRNKGINKIDIYSQIIDNTRHFLFDNAKVINWDATVWYMDRLKINEVRINPAREIVRFNFGCINNLFNRQCLQKYMKYCIGLTDMSLQTIRCIFYEIIEFLRFCDLKDINLYELTTDDIEEYVDTLEEKNIISETFNSKIYSMELFLNYMTIKHVIPDKELCASVYYKKIIPSHKDRSLSSEIQNEVLEALKQLPYEMRLIFLNSSQAGIRISEACVLKGDSYYFDGEDAWMRVYQGKLKKEKQINIPEALYLLMKDYIKKNHIGPSEYIFKNKRGKAYDSGRFTKDFKKQLKEVGINDYNYRSHDYRHCVATELYDANVPLEVIRDYLGHDETEMTRRYVDHMQTRADEANKEYFNMNKILEKK